MSAPKVELRSQLHEVVDAVNQVADYQGKKSLALEMVNKLTINEDDKRKMLMIIEYQTPNAFKLTNYLYNSMLKFEGLGSVNKPR